jgi:hypothetical protein|tara:strand:+ start:67 stop:222 length:156 start_codon:yes stop_codon:yes gene_type:complete
MTRIFTILLFIGLAWGQARNQPIQTGEYYDSSPGQGELTTGVAQGAENILN